MKNLYQPHITYDDPWVILELMKNLNKVGFKAVFSFEGGMLKLIIQKQEEKASSPHIY